MKKKTELDLTQPVYVCINATRGTWCCDESVALAERGARTRKKDRSVIYRVGGIQNEPLTADDLDIRKNGGYRYEGYKVGDLLHPWVSNSGSLVYKGTCHRRVYNYHGDIEWWPMNEVGQAVHPSVSSLAHALQGFLNMPGVREFLDDNCKSEVNDAVLAVGNAGYFLNK